MRPRDEADLAEAVAGATGGVQIQGGGTRWVGQVRGQVLDASGLSGVRLYEPGALTLVAGAGTPLTEIEATLATEGQRLAFDPPDLRALLGRDGVTTIGGIVAANASGPRRVQAGACRDALIGVRFVDGMGVITRNGGRVMKNVTGYDLVKLMAGSRGTLGVLSEVALKVLPGTEASATLEIAGLSDSAGLAALSAALGSPYEVSGAAHLGGPGARTVLRIEGFEAQVAHRAARLTELLAPWGVARVERAPDAVQALWAQVRDVTVFADQPGDVWRLHVVPGDAAALVAGIAGARALYDWGGGLVWLLLPEGRDLRVELGPIRGHATLMRAAPETFARLPAIPPENPVVARLSRDLRARFDPRGILNPGLMG
ncbi:MAG: FAD-binding protein [Qingshengfaniella sp.]